MTVTVAAVQMACGPDREANPAKAASLVRAAASAGANIVLPQEMFATRFFDFMDWKPSQFALAEPVYGPTVGAMATLARDLGVVIPVSNYERANNAYYNTVAVIDADGTILGIHRKTHIPVGPPGCFEKVYMSPGDTGFRVWRTAFGSIGVGICWDQWFPEAARIMCLLGAGLLLYPAGIGSECHDHWRRVMQGHGGANLTPLVAANRVGAEAGDLGATNSWGRSFVAGPTGKSWPRPTTAARPSCPRPSILKKSARRAPTGACSTIAAPTPMGRC